MKFHRLHLHLLLLVLVALVILIPRSLAITREQSERVDDQYHLVRGIAYLRGDLPARADLPLNDPPLGEGVTVLPLWLARCWAGNAHVTDALYGHRFTADQILAVIGLWKSLLFIPGLIVIFLWCRDLYGIAAGWLAATIVLIEPTFAAHIPLPTIDVLGVEAIVIACYLSWRFFGAPSRVRLATAAVAIGAAMMIKHTALLVPIMFIAYAALNALKPQKAAEKPISWKRRALDIVIAGAIVFVVIWSLCFFDFAHPRAPQARLNQPSRFLFLTNHRLPASLYVTSLLEAISHAGAGQMGYLLGHRSKAGWWYYFPVVATYKVPIGLGVLFLLALSSFFWRKFAFEELGLLVPAVAWTALMMSSKVDIGFRHFLPAYVFILMLCCRVAAIGWRWQIAAWICVIASAIHAMSFGTDQLAYINFPRKTPYFDINDSNIDWGQGLRAARRWIDAHPDRLVFVRDFSWGPARLSDVRHCVGSRARVLDKGDPLPRQGVLIISVGPLAGIYEHSDPFRVLRDKTPVAMLDHCMAVYDLDALRGNKPFHWPTYRAMPRDKHGKEIWPAPGPDTPRNLHPAG